MKKLTIREIIQATGAQMIALGDMEQCLNRIISHVTTDSREVKKGSLFVAVKGETRDGHDFIPQCFEQHKGIACFSEKVMVPAGDGILLLVKDTRQAFLDLAKYYRDQFDIPFIGITGSVGKTSTKDMVASVVSQRYDTLWTQGNFNNDLGVPMTLFRLEEHHQAAVIEMGMNHAGEIDRLAKVVRPDIGIISNVGVAHIEYLGSRADRPTAAFSVTKTGKNLTDRQGPAVSVTKTGKNVAEHRKAGSKSLLTRPLFSWRFRCIL